MSDLKNYLQTVLMNTLPDVSETTINLYSNNLISIYNLLNAQSIYDLIIILLKNEKRLG